MNLLRWWCWRMITRMTSMVCVHKFIHHRYTLPDAFYNYFTSNSLIHNYATRQKVGLHLFSVNTTLGQRSIQYKSCQWQRETIFNDSTALQRFNAILLHKSSVSDYLQTAAFTPQKNFQYVDILRQNVWKCPGARFTKDLKIILRLS